MNTDHILKTLFLILLLKLQLLLVLSAEEEREKRKNLLFLIADDLRPEMNIYGRKHAITPNFDRLASKGVVFDRVYNQVPVCFPSRHSILTSLRPDTTGIITWTDAQMPFVDSLSSILIRQGYYSSGIGKLFHHARNKTSDYNSGRWDGNWYKYQNSEGKFMNASTTPDSIRDIRDFRDYEIASRTIKKIKELHILSSKTKRPFVISTGFKLPHTQYHVPRKYFDMYRNSTFLEEIRRSNDKEFTFPPQTPRLNYRCCAGAVIRYLSDDGRSMSKNTSGWLYGMMSFPGEARAQLMWGYLSAITFLDAQLGRVLDGLEETGAMKDTVIVFTSDHGMHVGEKGMWEKYTLFEETTRVPLLIADPWRPEDHGERYSDPIESVDIVPSILEILGIKRVPVLCPRARLCPEFDGRSFVGPDASLNPKDISKRRLQYFFRSKSTTTIHKNKDIDIGPYAVTQMRRCLYSKDERKMSNKAEDRWSAICMKKNRGDGSVMGYSIRSKEWRYTAWLPYDDKAARPMAISSIKIKDPKNENQQQKQQQQQQLQEQIQELETSMTVIAEELYDHRHESVGDLCSREQRNLVPLYFNESSISSSSSSSSSSSTNTNGYGINWPTSDMQGASFHAVHSALESHRNELRFFLATSVYSMKQAIRRTRKLYRKSYKLDASCRAKKAQLETAFPFGPVGPPREE